MRTYSAALSLGQIHMLPGALDPDLGCKPCSFLVEEPRERPEAPGLRIPGPLQETRAFVRGLKTLHCLSTEQTTNLAHPGTGGFQRCLDVLWINKMSLNMVTEFIVALIIREFLNLLDVLSLYILQV